VSGFVKKDWVMINFLSFFRSPIKSLTSMLRFVNLGYLIEIDLQRTAFSFTVMDWSKTLKEDDGQMHLSEERFPSLLSLGLGVREYDLS